MGLPFYGIETTVHMENTKRSRKFSYNLACRESFWRNLWVDISENCADNISDRCKLHASGRFRVPGSIQFDALSPKFRAFCTENNIRVEINAPELYEHHATTNFIVSKRSLAAYLRVIWFVWLYQRLHDADYEAESLDNVHVRDDLMVNEDIFYFEEDLDSFVTFIANEARLDAETRALFWVYTFGGNPVYVLLDRMQDFEKWRSEECISL